jgi:hypothetical protein
MGCRSNCGVEHCGARRGLIRWRILRQPADRRSVFSESPAVSLSVSIFRLSWIWRKWPQPKRNRFCSITPGWFFQSVLMFSHRRRFAQTTRPVRLSFNLFSNQFLRKPQKNPILYVANGVETVSGTVCAYGFQNQRLLSYAFMRFSERLRGRILTARQSRCKCLDSHKDSSRKSHGSWIL